MTHELRLNAQGGDVSHLHDLLAAVTGPVDPAERALSLFGTSTRDSLIAFQKRQGLQPIGVLDAATAAALTAAASQHGLIASDRPPVESPIDAGPLAPRPGRDAELTPRVDSIGSGDASMRQPAVAPINTALAEISGGDVRLARALQDRMRADPDTELAHLAALTPNDLIADAARADPDASLTQIEQVAAGLAAAIDARFPSAAFLTKLHTGQVNVPGYPADKVAAFLTDHPEFDLASTPVEPFLIDRGLAGDADLQNAVLSTQRVLDLGTSQAEATSLLRAGMTSAPRVLAAGRDALAAAVGPGTPEARTDQLFEVARQASSALLGIASITVPSLAGPDIPSLRSSPPKPELLARFPSLASVFGDQSARACTDCASVLSPAAYLVDLLRTLSRAGVEDELRTRRPDIAHLELTCANTHTELPYVDLVLEILESAVALPVSLTLTSAEHDELDAGIVPASVETLLESTVSSNLTAAVNMRSADDTLTFTQGHRRWGARRVREQVTVRRKGQPDLAMPAADTDAVRDGLADGTVAPALLAALAPEPRLPVSGASVQRARRGSSERFADLVYAVSLTRAVTVALSSSGAGGSSITFEAPDGPTLFVDLIRNGADLVHRLAKDLGNGRLPQYVANLLPPAAYTIAADGKYRWLLTTTTSALVGYDPGQLTVTSLTFSGSESGSDLTAMTENRNPLAYEILARERFPWSLPFDLFTEEIRLCLERLGVPRRDLIRALRPASRNASLLDAAETLRTSPAQLQRCLGESDQAGDWGLARSGNVLADPSGATGAPPIPTDWVGALSRLSVLQHRAGVPLPELLGALSSRYVSNGATPVLQPPSADRASRLTVAGLTEPILSRLHRFLRLRRITGWSMSDLDHALTAVTTGADSTVPPEPVTASALAALAAIEELCRRLDVTVETASGWLGNAELTGLADHHATFADAVGLDTSEYAQLRRITGSEPFSDLDAPPGERARRLPWFADAVEQLRSGGMDVQDLADALGAPVEDAVTVAERRLERLGIVRDLQAALRAASEVESRNPGESDVRARFAAAGWPDDAVERLLDGGADGVGLSSVIDLRVPLTKPSPATLPSGSPFGLDEDDEGLWLTAATDRLTAADDAALFADLAAITGFGPLADPASPAARLHAAWLKLQGQVGRLAGWLRSIDRTDPAVPGSGLLSDQDVRELMFSEPDPKARYARILRAAGPPLRRRQIAQLVAARFLIDPVLFDALDVAGRTRDPSVDVLAPLCTDSFLTADVDQTVSADVEAAVVELRRVGHLLNHLGVRQPERGWFDPGDGFQGLALLGIGALGGQTPADRYESWRRAAALFRLRDTIPGGSATLEAIRSAAVGGAFQDALRIIASAFQLGPGAESALALDGLLAKPLDLRDPLPPDLRDPLQLERVVAAASMLHRLDVPAELALRLCQDRPTAATAQAVRGLFAARYGNGEAADGLRSAQNELRERQRAALVDYLVHRDGAVDAADLHSRYLIDVEMGPEFRTSRVKQAISSTQLFIQRWLMNIEPALTDLPDPQFTKSWEWVRSYRVWEANRNVFLYPQMWLDPTLRDDKTHLFKKFESTLLQGPATSERAVDALREYLEGLDEISKITVLSMYRETTGPRAGTVHVVGRTQHDPAKYFYRQWRPNGAAGSWDPWEPVEVINNTDHLVVFIRNGRPHLAWLDVTTSTDADTADSNAAPTPAGGSDEPAPPSWSVRLLWSRRNQNGWCSPRRSPNAISHLKATNKGIATTFALRVEPAGPSGHTVWCYGGSNDAQPPRADPVPWPAEEISSQPSRLDAIFWVRTVSVQVLGQTADNRKVALETAEVTLWAVAPAAHVSFSAYQAGTPQAPLTLTHMGGGIYQTDIRIFVGLVLKDELTINVRATYQGKESPPTTTNQPAWRQVRTQTFATGDINLGLVITGIEAVAAGDLKKQIDPGRRLRLVPIATGFWGPTSRLRWERVGWDIRKELPRAPTAEHYCSGYQFRAGSKAVVLRQDLTTTSTTTNVLVVAATQGDGDAWTVPDERRGLGWPVYIEAEDSAAAGFVAADQHDDLIFHPAVEVTHLDTLRALDADPDRPQLATGGGGPRSVPLASEIGSPFSASSPPFDRALPYSNYVWEVFFHAPMMIAQTLATQQRFGEAVRWLSLIFDPTARPDGAQPSWWRFPPFAEAGKGVEVDLLLSDFKAGRLSPEAQQLFQAQLDFSRGSPFRPDGIARMRIRAYQWMAVLKWLDVLIAWGDQQFRRDTIESINEATQLYLLAAELLGRPPTVLPPREATGAPPTFADLGVRGDDWIALSDTPLFKQLLAWLQYLAQHGVGPGTAAFDTATARLNSLTSLQTLTFCVPRNEWLDRYWEMVGDRLVKIRSSQNIDGIRRRLDTWEPKLDPGLLVKAVAAGLDISSVMNETFAPTPPYRFGLAVQLAEEFCAEVKTLGAALLSALEKRDAEELSRLRSTQEIALLELVHGLRQRQLDEARANETALWQSRVSVEVRYRHLQRLLGKTKVMVPKLNEQAALDESGLRPIATNSEKVDPDLRGYGLTIEEADHLGWLTVANTYSLVSGSVSTASAVAHLIPTTTAGTPLVQVSFGGGHLGDALDAVSRFFAMLAGNASFQGNRSEIVARHTRRYDEWVQKSNAAAKELEQIDKQILAAQIRVDIARREIAQHERQQENARRNDEFLRDKFSNTELYQWTADRLSESHSAAFHLAYDLARRAQRSFAFELGVDDPGIVSFGAWDSRHRGLLAGERLSLDLKRLKSAYAERNRRELELTKRISLNSVDPIAMLRLKATGSCEFLLPELLFDLDFPGHYFRRIKAVTVTLPCVVGPYASVAGTLTLLENELRASPTVPRDGDGDYRRDVVAQRSVAISSGASDSGMFELNFRDERYLPFEGAGVISRWRFELPAEFRSFDYQTISDLILTIHYTARDGGDQLKKSALKRVREIVEGKNAELAAAAENDGLVTAISLRHQFPTQWARLTADPPTPQTITIGPELFPYVARDRTIRIWRLGLYLRGPNLDPNSPIPLTISVTRTGSTSTSGSSAPPQEIPWTGGVGAPVSGGLLHTLDLTHTSIKQVKITGIQSTDWTINPTSALQDIGLIFYWRADK